MATKEAIEVGTLIERSESYVSLAVEKAIRTFIKNEAWHEAIFNRQFGLEDRYIQTLGPMTLTAPKVSVIKNPGNESDNSITLAYVEVRNVGNTPFPDPDEGIDRESMSVPVDDNEDDGR